MFLGGYHMNVELHELTPPKKLNNHFIKNRQKRLKTKFMKNLIIILLASMPILLSAQISAVFGIGDCTIDRGIYTRSAGVEYAFTDGEDISVVCRFLISNRGGKTFEEGNEVLTSEMAQNLSYLVRREFGFKEESTKLYISAGFGIDIIPSGKLNHQLIAPLGVGIRLNRILIGFEYGAVIGEKQYHHGGFVASYRF